MKIYLLPKWSLLICLTQLVLPGMGIAGDQQALKTVSRVDLNRYVGTW